MTPEKFYRFCMSGTIRTKENCRKCGNKYQGKPLTCPTCLTTPHRYFIDLPWIGGRRALHWEDINWKQKTVTIHAAMDWEIYRPSTKEKDVRIIPLHPDCLIALRLIPRALTGFIFILQSKTLTGNQIYKTWMRAAKKAGIKINLYQGTKHSLGCQLLNSGVREDVLQALFGHKDRKSTKRYAKMVSDSLKYWEE